MFQNPFSVSGRIRRLEYGLTSLIVFFGQIIIGLLAEALGDELAIAMLVPYLALMYFSIVQGAKRCHDRGHSGWFQLIPFYALWMLFAEGKPGPNKYGPNPKNVVYAHDEILDAGGFV